MATQGHKGRESVRVTRLSAFNNSKLHYLCVSLSLLLLFKRSGLIFSENDRDCGHSSLHTSNREMEAREISAFSFTGLNSQGTG